MVGTVSDVLILATLASFVVRRIKLRQAVRDFLRSRVIVWDPFAGRLCRDGVIQSISAFLRRLVYRVPEIAGSADPAVHRVQCIRQLSTGQEIYHRPVLCLRDSRSVRLYPAMAWAGRFRTGLGNGR